VPGGDARVTLVPFVWDGVRYLVPGSELRHLKQECPIVKEAIRESGGWVDRVVNDFELKTSTARCTGGCWEAWERNEELAASRGDERKALDRQRDAIEGRARLARRISDGAVSGAVSKGSV
jgi:hypothetical protein